MALPNTMLIRLSHHIFKAILFKVKIALRTSNNEAHSDLFIKENLTSLKYSLLKKLKTENKRRNEHNLVNFEVVYTFQRKVFVEKAKTSDNEGSVQIPSSFSLKNFLDQLDASHRLNQNVPMFPAAAEQTVEQLPTTAPLEQGPATTTEL